MTAGILNVPAAARSLPPARASRASRARARLGPAAATNRTPGALMITQPSGRIAKARAERKLPPNAPIPFPSFPGLPTSADYIATQAPVAAADSTINNLQPSSMAALPTPPPSTFRPKRAKNTKQPSAAQPRGNVKSYQGSNRPKPNRSNSHRAKFARRFDFDMEDLEMTAVELDAADDRHSSSEDEVVFPKMAAPITPARTSIAPTPVPISSSLPVGNSFGLYSTPPHTPVRPQLAHSQSQSQSHPPRSHFRTPSAPFTPPPHSARYANSTFQSSPSPNVLPKPRFLDDIMVEKLPLTGMPPSMLFGEGFMVDVDMDDVPN